MNTDKGESPEDGSTPFNEGSLEAVIQTLNLETVVPEDELAKAEENIARLEAIVFNSKKPAATLDPHPPTDNETLAHDDEVLAHDDEVLTHDDKAFTHSTSQEIHQQEENSNQSQTGNPFLPSHILERLKQDNKQLIDEIAQSGEALNASTATLRSHKRAKPSSFANTREPTKEEVDDRKTKEEHYKIIDGLVEEYLPLIAADLRRKLKLLLDK